MAKPISPPTLSQIAAGGRLHQSLEQWRLSDQALRRLHESLPEFDFETCLLKSLAINALYGTQVLAIIPMSLHVQRVLRRRAAIRPPIVFCCPSMSIVVLVVGSDPVFGDSFLCGSNIELPTADHVAHEPLQSVLGLGIPFRLDTTPRFRP